MQEQQQEQHEQKLQQREDEMLQMALQQSLQFSSQQQQHQEQQQDPQDPQEQSQQEKQQQQQPQEDAPHSRENHNHNHSQEVDWQAAAQHLSNEELLQIQQALAETNPEKSGTNAATSLRNIPHVTATTSDAAVVGTPSIATAAFASAATATDSHSDALTEEERRDIERAIAEADAELERQSYQLALQMAAQEQQQGLLDQQYHSHRQQPQGHVRLVTREQWIQEGHAHGGSSQNNGVLQHDSNYDDYNDEYDYHYYDDEDDDHDEAERIVAGFRINAQSALGDMPAQAWTRRDAHTVIGPDAQIRTKHDTALHAAANAHRLALSVHHPTDATATTVRSSSSNTTITTGGVGNRAYNSFQQSMTKRRRHKGVAAHGTGRAGSDADGTKGGAMDTRVRQCISKAVNQGVILSKLNGAVKEGKEAIIYHGEPGTESDGFDVAVKVFKRIQEFRGRGSYVDGDPRYGTIAFGKTSARQQLELWTEKEYRNLVRANRAGVPVATPLQYKENILFMRFLGQDGWPAPQLREIDLRKGSKRWTTLYEQVLHSMRLLYQDARLVHGDLSEYNILAVPAFLVQNQLVVDVKNEVQAVLIDFGQAVDKRHVDAENLLRRDVDRVQAFFARQGVVTMSPEEAYQFIVVPDEKEEEKDNNDDDGENDRDSSIPEHSNLG